MAAALMGAVADTGADAVKFQCHIADAESGPDEPWRVDPGRVRQDESRYAYWKRMEFTEDQWRQLRDEADELGLDFIVSPFSVVAVDMMERVAVDAFKVASGEVTNIPLLERIRDTELPVFLSTGMSTIEEIDRAVSAVGLNDTTIMQCTSMYPCPPKYAGLGHIARLKHRYRTKVGFSDHSGEIAAGIAAVTLGADALEVHIRTEPPCGPDADSSLTVDEIATLVDAVSWVEAAETHSKGAVAEKLSREREIFRQSLVYARDVPAGEVLGPGDVTTRKAGRGLAPDRLPTVLGRAVGYRKGKGAPVEWTDFA